MTIKPVAVVPSTIATAITDGKAVNSQIRARKYAITTRKGRGFMSLGIRG